MKSENCFYILDFIFIECFLISYIYNQDGDDLLKLTENKPLLPLTAGESMSPLSGIDTRAVGTAITNTDCMGGSTCAYWKVQRPY